MRPPSPMPPARRRTGSGSGVRGFSLIELLVAMAVLAALAAISFRGLGSILEAQARVQSETRRWNAIAIVVAHLGRDLSLAAARPVRDDAGLPRAALVLEPVEDSTRVELRLTRLGDGDGVAQADPRRIGYRIRGSTLEYLVWPTLDAAPGAAPAVNAILEDVADLKWRALGPDGGWVALWPGGQPANVLPRAIEAQIVLTGGERITRLFPVR